ncbi:MAG: hypothetical protein RLZZ34_1124 [Verrucomicrobiota bacterium]
MRIPSFRLKIALLSGILSGGPLLVAALLFWNWTYRRDLDRLDRELRNLGVEHLERVNGGDHWSRFENALRFVGGTEQPAQFILWVRQQNRELHRSEQWPTTLDPQALPALDDYEPPYQPQPGTPPPPPPAPRAGGSETWCADGPWPDSRDRDRPRERGSGTDCP